jgi:RNA polymerase sigma-70 factor (ECF subfamily)
VLVVAARAGEVWAQEALFRRYFRMANGMAFRLMGRAEDVDDVVQESFAEALDSIHKLSNPQAFASWLASLIVRTACKLLRRRRLLRRFGFGEHSAAQVELLIARTAPPDVACELQQIYSMLDRLPEQARVALVLRRVDGLSIDEIAAGMGISPATVKRRLSVAEAELERSLQAPPEVDDER